MAGYFSNHSQSRFLANSNAASQTQTATTTAAAAPGPVLHVSRAPGEKCARCWRVLPEVGQQPRHPALCRRCAGAVEALSCEAAAE